MIKKKSNRLISRNITHQKRKLQTCKLFEVKVDKSHLNQTTKEHMNRLFLEGKWFYNHILSQDNIFETDYKVNEVEVKVKDKFEIREINCLSSQMKQGILDRTKINIKGLSVSKKKRKIGKLKFKSEINSIPLNQFGKTYKILDDKYIKIQKIEQKLKVNGIEQIPKDSDIANANLIHKNNNYYIQITTFQKKEEFKPKNRSVGIDFGIKNQLTLSNGVAIKYSIPLTNRIKRIAHNLSRKELHSKNWNKERVKLNKEYDKLNNIKHDIKNKVVSHLKNKYRTICYQDESIKEWQRIYGKNILYTSIGGIIRDLKTKSHTPIEVDKFYPSTKTCSCCLDIKKKNKLSMRIYKCKTCGYVIDRDLNAAINIKCEGLRNQIGTERIEFKPVEIKTSTLTSMKYLNSIPYVEASLIVETGSHYF